MFQDIERRPETLKKAASISFLVRNAYVIGAHFDAARRLLLSSSHSRGGKPTGGQPGVLMHGDVGDEAFEAHEALEVRLAKPASAMPISSYLVIRLISTICIGILLLIFH